MRRWFLESIWRSAESALLKCASSLGVRAATLQRTSFKPMSSRMFRLIVASLLLVAPLAQAVTVYKFVDANGVVNYTDKAAPGAKVFVFQDKMVEHLEQQVHLQTSKSGNADVISVNNELFAPVEVELLFNGVGNVVGAPAGPIRQVIPARQIVRLATLTPQQPNQPLRYTPKLKYALGDPRRVPLPYLYPLPWQGGPFRMSQGPNGKYSHFGPKGKYAIDIAMPEGTPIVAARAGTVVKIENGQSGRGSDPSGNFVRILHDDGTMGVYLHLTEGSVQVREGQQVAVGTPLARSGNTGNSSGPHLHFVVQRNVGLALESIPYDFNQPVNSLPNFALSNQSQPSR